MTVCICRYVSLHNLTLIKATVKTLLARSSVHSSGLQCLHAIRSMFPRFYVDSFAALFVRMQTTFSRRSKDHYAGEGNSRYSCVEAAVIPFICIHDAYHPCYLMCKKNIARELGKS